MYLRDAAFDAVITDRSGLTLEVDCRITEPAAGGLPASISIEIPLSDSEPPALENPCSLRSASGPNGIEIKELWYRSIPAGATRRRHARGEFNINHVGQLWIKASSWPSERSRVLFVLSPVRFFKKHYQAEVDYTATPEMAVELFKLQTAELGAVRFLKFWSIHHIEDKGVAAEIRASFAAEVRYDEATAIPMDSLVEKIRSVLRPLSILTRQAITLHGWIWERRDGNETMWFDPLDPNLAPDMAEEPVADLCLRNEFDACAQAFVQSFLAAPADTQEAVTLISVALAPHVKRTAAGNFLALFSALEQVIALEKLTNDERKKLRETDSEVMAGLLDLAGRVKTSSSPNAAGVAARIEGFAKSVEGSGPSFNVRFEKFQAAHPKLAACMSDLWPLRGTTKLPGLKQIRDSLAHGLRQEYSAQAIAEAHWHFARLAERLAFIVLGVDMPQGLLPNSFFLQRDPWYKRSEWQAVRAAAKQKD
ncbi:hypothetical protein [Roseateles sp. BYS87W]|uniref:ApeA N-terminal domain-containing protein n=1 Tax=Pelomonas baiyunensis TaxID=3299026 RepID=A0ABW7GXY2_9BURK